MSLASTIRTAAAAAAIAAATFTAATTAPTTQAEAKSRIHISIGGYGHGYHGGYYRPYHGGGCYWLKMRAMDTGSGYWWSRYHACRGW